MQKRMHIMDHTGHTTLTWGAPTDELTEAEVKEKFDDLISKSYLGYKIDAKGNKEQVRSFDEIGEAEKVVMHAPIAGG